MLKKLLERFDFRQFSLTGLLALAVVVALDIFPVAAQNSGTFPTEPFNGMQISYSVSGAITSSSTDTVDFTTSRRMQGHLESGQLRVSGVARMGSGLGADLVVTVWAGSERKEFTAYIEAGSGGLFNEQAFDVAVTIPSKAQEGGFSIRMTGNYNLMDPRGLVVSATLQGAGPDTPGENGLLVEVATSGSFPQLTDITFAGNVSGGTPPYNYAWNFGDGRDTPWLGPVGGKIQDTHAYDCPGSYDVTLVAQDSITNESSDSKAIEITSTFSTAEMGISCTAVQGQYPDQFGNFYVRCTAVGGPSGGLDPYSFYWDFGEGLERSRIASGPDKTVTYDYWDAGNYTIKLTAFDNCNSEGTEQSFSMSVGGALPPPGGNQGVNQPPSSPTLLGPEDADFPGLDPSSITFQWQDNGDPEGDPVGFYLSVAQYDPASDEWTTVFEDRVETKVIEMSNFQPDSFYAWRVFACDWSKRSDPWSVPSDWSHFSTFNSDYSFSVQQPPPPADELARPPAGSDSTLEQALDTNGNGTIDDAEIRAAIQLWILGQTVPGTDQTIDDAKIRQLTQMWILGDPVGGASVARSQTRASQGLHVETVQLSAPSALERELHLLGPGIEAINVQVFDLNGQLQLEVQGSGHQLRFSLLNTQGRPLANGVYLYVITADGLDGQRWQSAVRKLAVMR